MRTRLAHWEMTISSIPRGWKGTNYSENNVDAAPHSCNAKQNVLHARHIIIIHVHPPPGRVFSAYAGQMFKKHFYAHTTLALIDDFGF